MYSIFIHTKKCPKKEIKLSNDRLFTNLKLDIVFRVSKDKGGSFSEKVEFEELSENSNRLQCSVSVKFV